jgi:hypothetical protein
MEWKMGLKVPTNAELRRTLAALRTAPNGLTAQELKSLRSSKSEVWRRVLEELVAINLAVREEVREGRVRVRYRAR